MADRNIAVRSAGIIKWGAIAAIVVALFVLVRALPIDTGVDRLKRWVDGLGLWGPVVFGAFYVLGTLLFVPGAALTIAAGAVFGLYVGSLTVSIAATTAAALAFLIGRYLARSRVAELAARQPKFGAMDRAIGDGGWKIVAMLRLVPLFPFSAGNYLLGLTRVGFWPYVGASGVFMLPGTFMYIYIGYLGVESLEAASQTEASVGVGRIILLVVGLFALVGATVYMTKLAKARLAEAADLELASATADAPSTEVVRANWFSTAVLGVVSLALLVVAMVARANQDRLAGLFGPPLVVAQEAYGDTEAGARFDHSAFDALLAVHVDDAGYVDYAGLKGEQAALDTYLGTLDRAAFDELSRDGKLAFLINAYNAFTLRLILDRYPIDSIKRIPDAERWDAVRWELMGRTVSLNQIEHEMIRKSFAEPRIHFALVCAAVGCPKLRNETFAGDRLEAQLADQTRYVHEHDRWFSYDADNNIVKLTRLYNWYGSDFEQAAGSVLEFVGKHSAAVREAVERGATPKIQYLHYDWGLNDQARLTR